MGEFKGKITAAEEGGESATEPDVQGLFDAWGNIFILYDQAVQEAQSLRRQLEDLDGYR